MLLGYKKINDGGSTENNVHRYTNAFHSLFFASFEWLPLSKDMKSLQKN